MRMRGKLTVQTSRTSRNPYHRFVACPKNNIPGVMGCNIFEWVDPAFPYQAKKEIRELQDDKSKYITDCIDLSKKLRVKSTELEKLQHDHNTAMGEYEFHFEDTKKEIKEIEERRKSIAAARNEINAEKKVICLLKWFNIAVAIVLQLALFFILVQKI